MTYRIEHQPDRYHIKAVVYHAMLDFYCGEFTSVAVAEDAIAIYHSGIFNSLATAAAERDPGLMQCPPRTPAQLEAALAKIHNVRTAAGLPL